MKKSILFLAMLLATLVCTAKDVKTLVVTTNPQMHCANCENKIKGNLRYEAGLKEIVTSVPDQTVTITYDAEKTNEENIIAAFSKFGYTATKVTPNTTEGTPKTCCGKCKDKKNKKNKTNTPSCCAEGGATGCGAAHGGCPKKNVEQGGDKPSGCCGAGNGCPKKPAGNCGSAKNE